MQMDETWMKRGECFRTSEEIKLRVNEWLQETVTWTVGMIVPRMTEFLIPALHSKST